MGMERSGLCWWEWLYGYGAHTTAWVGLWVWPYALTWTAVFFSLCVKTDRRNASCQKFKNLEKFKCYITNNYYNSDIIFI